VLDDAVKHAQGKQKLQLKAQQLKIAKDMKK
jgi:hypothetical protein